MGFFIFMMMECLEGAYLLTYLQNLKVTLSKQKYLPIKLTKQGSK